MQTEGISGKDTSLTTSLGHMTDHKCRLTLVLCHTRSTTQAGLPQTHAAALSREMAC